MLVRINLSSFFKNVSDAQKKGCKFKQPLKKKAANRPQPWSVLWMVYAIDGPPRTTGTVAAAAADAASLDM